MLALIIQFNLLTEYLKPLIGNILFVEPCLWLTEEHPNNTQVGDVLQSRSESIIPRHRNVDNPESIWD